MKFLNLNFKNGLREMKNAVSVIIPTYGRPHGLREAIRSVKMQRHRPLEIVVVDDNPPLSENRELTRILCDDEGSQESDGVFFKYVGMPSNSGGAIARNFGIKEAAFDLVTFLDDDDVYLSDKVERQVRHMLENDLDISICAMKIYVGGVLTHLNYSRPVGTTLEDFLIKGNVFTPMVMVKKGLLQSLGGFENTPRFQDHVLMIKMLESRPKTQILNEELFIHHIHAGERVTYSSKSKQGFIIKHVFENRNLHLLSGTQQSLIRFRQDLDLKICDAGGSVVKSVLAIAKKSIEVRSFKEFSLCVKYFIDKFRNFLVRRNAFK